MCVCVCVCVCVSVRLYFGQLRPASRLVTYCHDGKFAYAESISVSASFLCGDRKVLGKLNAIIVLNQPEPRGLGRRDVVLYVASF